MPPRHDSFAPRLHCQLTSLSFVRLSCVSAFLPVSGSYKARPSHWPRVRRCAWCCLDHLTLCSVSPVSTCDLINCLVRTSPFSCERAHCVASCTQCPGVQTVAQCSVAFVTRTTVRDVCVLAQWRTGELSNEPFLLWSAQNGMANATSLRTSRGHFDLS